MQNFFGKEFKLGREGIFLLSLPLITIAFNLIRPQRPFELIVGSFFVFLVVPFLITRFILGESIHFMGFKKGYPGRAISGLIIGWAIFLPILNLLADQKEFQAIYPVFTEMKDSLSSFILYQILVFLPVFIGVQTFIFGYAYEGIKRMIGKSKTMLALSFIGVPLFYLGRPAVEIILAMLASLVTCWIRERSRSVVYPIIFGWGLSLILDSIILYKIFTP